MNLDQLIQQLQTEHLIDSGPVERPARVRQLIAELVVEPLEKHIAALQAERDSLKAKTAKETK